MKSYDSEIEDVKIGILFVVGVPLTTHVFAATEA